MKHTKIKAALAVFLLCAAFFAVWVHAEEHGAIGWYFKKTDDHTLPPLDASLSYIAQYDGYYADTDAKEDDRVIYLTFDAGYENGNVAKILDVLKKHNIHGAFFVLSHLVKAEPELVRRMITEGHLVCNHTASHKDMTTLSEAEFREELSSLAALYKETTGRDMAMYFRPPEGKFSQTVLAYAQKAGYKTIFWSLAYPDWDNNRQPDPEKAKENLLAHTHNGMVLLLHPTSATNAAILDDLLCAWEKEGYRFGTLDELTAKDGTDA
ncbi:MAG: polysaccharide deacetylase family protein [Eubacteriales bacterium]